MIKMYFFKEYQLSFVVTRADLERSAPFVTTNTNGSDLMVAVRYPKGELKKPVLKWRHG